MSRFLTIFRFEWQWLLRHRLLIPLILLLLAMGSSALFYGHAVVAERVHVSDSIRRYDRHRFDSLSYQLTVADTATVDGKKLYKQLSHPAVVQFQLKPATLLPAAPLSMLSLGMSDIASYYHRLEVSWSYLHGEEKINNPLKLLTGNLDLSFMLIYIFPLLLAGVSYNILSRENEQGTYVLLAVQGAKTGILLTARLLVRWILFFLVFMLLALVAPLTSGGGMMDLLSWGMITATYMLFWCMLIGLIAAFNRSSAFNIAIMTVTWVLLLILLPAVFRLKAAGKQAATQTATVAVEQREQEWAIWDMPRRAMLDSFYRHYPHFRNAAAYDTSSASSRHTAAYYDLVARRMDRFIAADEALRREQQGDLVDGYLYNPTVYAQSLLNRIAHTDVEDYSHYEQETKRFHRQWKEYFFPFMFNNRSLTAADYLKIPVFHHSVVPTGHSVVQGALYLLLLSIVMGVAAICIHRSNHYH
jgi:ABC-2 type transport system permease protein